MIPLIDSTIPWITTDQMREVDRLMTEVYRIQLIQMMENAGRNLARLAIERFCNGHPQDKRIVVLAGSGGNGGGALVAARWLHNAGAGVDVILAADTGRFNGVSAHQLDILRQLNVSIRPGPEMNADRKTDLIIDGMVGYSLKGTPRGIVEKLIDRANVREVPVLALDVPSGVDASTGEVFTPAIKAAATLTLALPKVGLQIATAQVGELYLADIGVPPQLYSAPPFNFDHSVTFGNYDVVQIRKE